MSEQDLDQFALRENVEIAVQKQKRLYRMIFFAVHAVFYFVSMFVVWRTVSMSSIVADVFSRESSEASLIVLVPTLMWSVVILFHIASLYFESKVGEKKLREQLLIRELGKTFLYKGTTDLVRREKVKRELAHGEFSVRISDDGELITEETSGLKARHYTN
ncbi:MAG TPA: hypothetical protein PLD47_17805 [Aggregatilineales bacterium]|nr:hypothetical protein [Anaerolineales bacterium]HRE49585.1 hypothetical protein [Aggregatilineales bacterium]